MTSASGRYKQLLTGRRIGRRHYTIDGFGAVTVCRPIGKAVFRLAAAFCALVIPLIVMLDVRTDPHLAEWWTRNIQLGWERVVGTLTSWIPCSLLELLIISVIGLGVFMYIRLIVNLGRANFKRIVLGAAAIAVGLTYVLNLYVFSMGFGYYRAEMPLPQSQKKYDAKQAGAVVEYFFEDYKQLALKMKRDENGCVIRPYTFSVLADKLRYEFSKLDGGYFGTYTPKPKQIVNSWFLSDMLITGITFLPTGEANVNVAAPPTISAITTAHEIAHTKGVMREGDANLLARYVLISSDDDYLRYCGYYASFDNLLETLILTEDYDSYTIYGLEIDKLVYNEKLYAYEYWRSQPDIIGKIAEFFNNLYLESNGAPNGTGSYNDGNTSEVVTPIDPSTGEPSRDPTTGEIVREIFFSQVQKMFFAVYESRTR